MRCHLAGLKWLQKVLGLLLLWPLAAFAEQPQVVASIKPLHSLVAGVMHGVGEPFLLIQGGASPHEYSLRPSEVRTINGSAIVFWIGPALESVLVKPLENAKAKTRSITLLAAPGVETLPLREGGVWESHAHDDKPTGHPADHSHAHEPSRDAHIWLDPINAIAMARRIVTVLGEVDSAHQADYERNGAALIARLQHLNQQLATELTPIKDRPYIVFHDAYQYFERRYGLNAVGSVVLNPDQRPGAKRVSEIQARIRNLNVRCVFSEPQFQPALVETVIAGGSARRGVLDPLGSDLSAGVEAYFNLLQGLAHSLKTCLSGA
ncbi:MAG: zinc ABC transporter substrate-binding protein [Candidatus Competibacteraceae bacterium]|nr:zinc ABC transporter substrate-binding protein [Candidatus Competibacteraceae bacterium]